MTQDDKYGTLWTRDETILALYLYCQIPFSRTKRTEPAVQRLADVIGRTPSSVARKLGNLGAFDSRLAADGISGLTHTSRLGQDVWDEYQGRWGRLVEESHRILRGLGSSDPVEPRAVLDTADSREPESFSGPTDVERTVRARRAQGFFRRSVLSSYEGRCAFCGFDLPEMIVAGHIVPWAVRDDLRADPRNGLALCSIHDKAFDRGFMAVTADYRLATSDRIRDSSSDAVHSMLTAYAGEALVLPARFAPDPDHLGWHRENVFGG